MCIYMCTDSGACLRPEKRNASLAVVEMPSSCAIVVTIAVNISVVATIIGISKYSTPVPSCCVDMCIDMCVGMFVHLRVDMRMDMYVDMCVDICVGMWVA